MASEEIIQKLVTLLGFKLSDQAILKRYDKTIADSQKKFETGYKKVSEKVALFQQKIAEKSAITQAKLDERKVLFKQKMAERELKVVQKTSDTALKINARAEETKIKLAEKASQFKQRLDQQASQFDQKRADRALLITERLERAKIKIRETSEMKQLRDLERYGRLEEREMNRRLAARRKAENKAKKDDHQDNHGLGMVGTMGSMFFGHKIKEASTTFGDFESAIIKVKAKTGASDHEIEGLKELALDLGRKTQFDPIEIANLFGEGAGQGYNIADIKKLTPNVLNVSTITGKDPAESMRLMSETLHQFGIQAKDSEQVADVLGISIGRLGVKAENFGFTMKYAGQLSREMGIDLKHAAALAILQSRAGIVGSTGGTSVRRALSNIAAKDGAIAILDKLKIQRFDKNDNMDIFRILGELDKKTSKMKKGDKAAVFKGLFEQTAFAPMMGLAHQIGSGGGDKVLKTLGSLSSAGIAQDMFKGLNAELKLMNSSILTLDKVIGEQLAPKLEFFANIVRNVADYLSAMDPVTLQVIANLMLLGFAVSSITAAFVAWQILGGYLAPIGVAIASIFAPLTAGFGITLGVLGAFVALAAAIVYVGYQIYKTITTGKSQFTTFANFLNKLFLDLFGWDIPGIFDTLISKINGFTSKATDIFNTFIEKVKTMWSGLGDFIANALNTISFGAININPTVNSITPNKSLQYTNHNQITQNLFGSKASPTGLGDATSHVLQSSANKQWSMLSELHN